MIKKILTGMKASKRQDLAKDLTHKLIKHEAELGGKLFGELPAGHRREFFCLDKHTWIWYEEWIDGKGVQQTTVTRYEMRTSGVFKSQNGGSYKGITQAESKNLRSAVTLYKQNILDELYA